MVQYDHQGRMAYNPEYHGNHGKLWADKDLIYLCSMAEVMKVKDLSMALERTEMTTTTKLSELRKRYKHTKEYGNISMYDYYKKLGRQI